MEFTYSSNTTLKELMNAAKQAQEHELLLRTSLSALFKENDIIMLSCKDTHYASNGEYPYYTANINILVPCSLVSQKNDEPVAEQYPEKEE